MRKIYHLSTCTTNKRIIQESGLQDVLEMIDIKKQGIKSEDLDFAKSKVGSYEALFSRKSMKYRPMGLHERELSEQDYRDLILQEYSFLKRPLVIIDEDVFYGSTKDQINLLNQKIQEIREKK